MKGIVFGVFLWFLAQLIILSMAHAGGYLAVANGEKWCGENPSIVEAELLGAVFPMTEFTFVNTDWCWVPEK